MATVIAEASVRISPDTSQFVEQLRRDLQTDLKAATTGQGNTVDINVRADTSAAKATLTAFRTEQERNPLNLRVEIDRSVLDRITQTATATGVLGQRVREATVATQGLRTALSETEVATARVTQAADNLSAAHNRVSDSATKAASAEQLVVAAEERHERSGQALLAVEQRLAEARNRVRPDTEAIAALEEQLSKARETHATNTAKYYDSELKLTQARRDQTSATTGLTRATTDHESALSRLRGVQDDDDRGSERRVGLLGRLASGIGSVADGTGLLGRVTSAVSGPMSGLTGGLQTLGGGAISAAGAIAQLASQVAAYSAVAGAVTFAVGGLTAAVLTLPTAAAAGASAFAVLKLGFDGFSDAIKEAKTPEELKRQEEAIRKLEPAAQSAARAFNSDLRPAITDLKKEIQSKLFVGLDQTFRDLSQTVRGPLKTGLSGVAESMNLFIRESAKLVTGEEGMRRVSAATTAAKTVLDTARPGVISFVRSFLDLAGFPPIAQAVGGIVGDLGQKTADFFDKFRQGPQAAATMTNLRSVVGTVYDALLDIAGAALNFFNQSTPGFNNLVGAARSLATTLINGLGGAFNTLLNAAGDFIRSIPPSSIDGIKTAFQGLADKVQNFANSGASEGIARGFQDLIKVAGVLVDTINFLSQSYAGLSQTGDKINASIDRVLGTTRNADGSIKAMGQSASEVEKSLAGMGQGAQQGARDLGSAAPVARASTEAIVNGVKVPLSTLPTLTQQQFDQVPKIVQLQLQEAARAAASGTPPIAYGVQGPMSQVPGVTQAEFAKLKPEIQKQLVDAANAAKSGTAPIPTNVGDALKDLPGKAGNALAPTAPAVTGEMGKAADAGKAGAVQLVAGIDFAPIVDKARQVFGEVPGVITDGVNKAVTVTQSGGQRIVAALKLDGLTAAARKGADGVPTAVKTALSQAENAAKTGVAAIIAAANFAGIATSAETELAKIPQSVQTHLTTASASVGQIGTAMVTTWQQNMTQLVSINDTSWQTVVRTIDTQGRASLTSADGTARGILQVFLNLANPMYTAGVQMMTRLAAGIQAGGQQAITAARNVATQIQGLFPSSPPKWGPLSGSGDPLLAGERTMDRYGAGVTAGADGLARSAAVAASKVASELAAGVSGLSVPVRPSSAGAGSSGVMSSGGRATDEALLRRVLAAAGGGSSAPASSPAPSQSSSPARADAGPSAADIYAATKAGTEAAMSGMTVKLEDGVVRYVNRKNREIIRRGGSVPGASRSR